MALEKAKDFVSEHPTGTLLFGTAAGLMVAAIVKVGPRVVEQVRSMDLFDDEEAGPNVSDPSGSS